MKSDCAKIGEVICVKLSTGQFTTEKNIYTLFFKKYTFVFHNQSNNRSLWKLLKLLMGVLFYQMSTNVA